MQSAAGAVINQANYFIDSASLLGSGSTIEQSVNNWIGERIKFLDP